MSLHFIHCEQSEIKVFHFFENYDILIMKTFSKIIENFHDIFMKIVS